MPDAKICHFLFVILYFIFPILFVFFARLYKFDILRITIPTVLLYSFFIFTYIGNIILYFGLDSQRYELGVQDKAIMFQVFLLTTWSIFSLFIGFIFTSKAFKYSKTMHLMPPTHQLSKSEIYILLFICVLCLFISFIYMQFVPNVAIWTLFTKGIKAAKVARSQMGNDFAGKHHWFSLFFRHLPFVITFVFFSNWLIAKNLKSFLLFFSIFLFTVFLSVMSIEKGPLVYLILGLFFTYLITCKRSQLDMKSIIFLTPFLLLSLIVMYSLFVGTKDIFSSIISILSRTFTGQLQPAYHYLEYFPDHHEFLWGRSFPNPSNILPHEPFRLSVEVMNWKFPKLKELNIVGSMPAMFWGELYANFGKLGVVIIPFFVGAGLYVVNAFVCSFEKTPLTVGFYVWLILHYMNLSGTSLSGYILDFYLFGILFFIAAIQLIKKRSNIADEANKTFS